MIPKRALATIVAALLAASICLASAHIYSQQGSSVTQTIKNKSYYYVDQLSNVDSQADKGTHSNFTAQQSGPDSGYDTLTESSTGGAGSVTIDRITTYAGTGNSFSFSHTCSGSDRLLVVNIHCDNGNAISSVTYAGQSLTMVTQRVHPVGRPRVGAWRLIAPPTNSNTVAVTLAGGSGRVTIGAVSYNGVDQTTPIDGARSAQGTSNAASVTVVSQTGDLVQDAMAALSPGASSAGPGQMQLYNREMGGSGTSNHFGAASAEPGAPSVTMSWSLTAPGQWVDLGFNINPSVPNYELDLEVHWTNVDFSEANEELCIYGGSMGSESLRVDVWTGSTWQNMFVSLATGWNNITVSAYLSSSTFTVRFRGSIETADLARDSWSVDATLLHVWS